MDYIKVKNTVCEVLKRIYYRGLISGGDGNISVRLADGPRVLSTPKGYHKGLLTPDDLALVDLDGNLISGPDPTSELDLHLELYRMRTDIGAILHAHPPWTTALYVAGKAINDPPILSEAAMVIGKVCVVPYYPPGSKALAEKVAGALKGGANVCVLMNHGVVTCGEDLMNAFMLMESLENCSKVTVFTHLLGGAQSFLKVPESPSSK